MLTKIIMFLIALAISRTSWAGVSLDSSTCDNWVNMANQVYLLRVKGESAEDVTRMTEKFIAQNPQGFDKSTIQFTFFRDSIRLSVKIGNLSYDQYPDPLFREQQARESCVAISDAAGYSEGD